MLFVQPYGRTLMAANNLLGHLHAQIIDDIKAWRSGGSRLSRNNEDITERWLQDQQARPDKLATMVGINERLRLSLYGDY